MSTTTAVEADEWVRRIGLEAAKARRTRSRLRIWAWSLLPVTIVLYAALIGVIAGFRRTGQDPGWVLLLVFLGAFALLGAIVCGVLARSTGFRMEGAALGALRPTVPDATPLEIRVAVRRVDRFDRWARERGAGAPAASPAAGSHVADPVSPAGASPAAASPAADPRAGSRPAAPTVASPAAAPASHATAPTTASSDTAPWQPDVSRALLRGRTSFEWFRLVMGMLLAAAPLMMVVMLTGLILRRLPGGQVIVLVLWCLLPAWMLLTLGCSVIGHLRQDAEYRAGYRTAMARTKAGSIIDDRTAVDLVDPKTGFVIRPACAPPLNRSTYDARIRQIRAAHPDATPQRLS
ncbi:MAG: hypothetical protein JST33_10930 [Actinobacteria bacterium]|nr:hypothetical protein [Actinomycetota bacterium]